MTARMKMMLQMVAGIFATGTLFVLFPVVGIIGLCVLGGYYYRKSLPGLVATGVAKLTTGIVISFIWVVFAQILLGWVFGVSLETFIKEFGVAKGLSGILSSSSSVSLIMFQEALILLVALGSLYIYLTSSRKRSTMYMTVCLAFFVLAYQAVDHYLPLHSDVKAHERFALTAARNVFSLWFSSKVNTMTNAKTNDIGYDIEEGKLPLHRYVTKEKVMYLESGGIRKLETGDLVLVNVGKQKPSKDGMLTLYYAVLYDDSRGNIAEGYTSLYNLSENCPVPVKVEVSHSVVKEPVLKTRLITLEKGEDWIKTGFVPNIHSQIFYEILNPKGCTISKVMARVGPHGNQVVLEPYLDNVCLGETRLTRDNPWGYEGEIKLADNTFDKVVIKAIFRQN